MVNYPNLIDKDYKFFTNLTNQIYNQRLNFRSKYVIKKESKSLARKVLDIHSGRVFGFISEFVFCVVSFMGAAGRRQ